MTFSTTLGILATSTGLGALVGNHFGYTQIGAFTGLGAGMFFLVKNANNPNLLPSERISTLPSLSTQQKVDVAVGNILNTSDNREKIVTISTIEPERRQKHEIELRKQYAKTSMAVCAFRFHDSNQFNPNLNDILEKHPLTIENHKAFTDLTNYLGLKIVKELSTEAFLDSALDPVDQVIFENFKSQSDKMVLTGRKIQTIPEVIQHFHWVKELKLSKNNIVNLSPIQHLKGLEQLYLEGNSNLKDLDPLKGCTALKFLDIRNTQASRNGLKMTVLHGETGI